LLCPNSLSSRVSDECYAVPGKRKGFFQRVERDYRKRQGLGCVVLHINIGVLIPLASAFACEQVWRVLRMAGQWKRHSDETMEQWESRLTDLMFSNRRCTEQARRRLLKRTTLQGRLRYLRGTLERWRQADHPRKRREVILFQGGLCNPR